MDPKERRYSTADPPSLQASTLLPAFGPPNRFLDFPIQVVDRVFTRNHAPKQKEEVQDTPKLGTESGADASWPFTAKFNSKFHVHRPAGELQVLQRHSHKYSEFIYRILRATCVGAALPGSGDRYGPCPLGSTFVRACFIAITFVSTTQEVRLRYYLDEGLTSVPQFGPPTPASAFSISSRVKYSSSKAVAAVSDSGSSYLGLGCPAPRPMVDGESATSICSLCAAGLDGVVQDCEEYEVTSEGLGRDKLTPSLSGHCDILGRKKRSRISRRVRRLEKTVESLSHGLILALTELKDFRGRSTTADGPKIDDYDVVDTQTTAFSSLSAVGDHPDSTLRASTPEANLHPSEQPDPTPQRKSTTPHTNANLTAPSVSGESKFGPTARPNSVVDHITTRNDSSLFVSKNWSPISGLLRPILDFMTCPEVFQFLKSAEAHAGLRSTQLFDLLWVSDNLFNVHGGILTYCLQKSLIHMDSISGVPGLSDWSQDRELMQKLDETYRQYLRPSIDTDGSCNSVTKVAWDLYWLNLGGIFSEQFPDWESAISFFQNLAEGYNGCLSPVITSSYIEDLSRLWAQVHPALLEVTRWLEPFIDYGPDYHRTTPLFDATIALGRHARELFTRRGYIRESCVTSVIREKNLMQLLREHRSRELRKMQREMESVMRGAISRNFDPTAAAAEEVPSAEVAALMIRAKQVTFWCTTEPRAAQMRDAVALGEVRVMRKLSPSAVTRGYRSGADPQRHVWCACADGTAGGYGGWTHRRKGGVLGWNQFIVVTLI
ncbi:hypothetical protein BJY52DRAFT_1379845 [Lactarius psammicola]|nr:hypothetical protein BJY52DRAFT_1379845 [Lactarius psammicola]